MLLFFMLQEMKRVIAWKAGAVLHSTLGHKTVLRIMISALNLSTGSRRKESVGELCDYLIKR